MTYSKFNAAAPSTSLNKWIDTLFNTTLADAMGTDFTNSSPSVNIVEHDAHFTMQLAAPGLQKSDFNINIENDYLVISAEKKTEKEETGNEGKFTRREFNYSSFKRSFQLDENINREGIAASYENGVLSITLPKKEETWKKPGTTTIEIK
ncbi:MAG: Hsp20/alpha crystallin family protein [Saprospiraceae bacterium]|nr:Hsp20/alpha crystallin family protein [Candidatus Opimibacter skivensis]